MDRKVIDYLRVGGISEITPRYSKNTLFPVTLIEVEPATAMRLRPEGYGLAAELNQI